MRRIVYDVCASRSKPDQSTPTGTDQKGYVTRRDICEFVPCSYNKSRKIFDTITQEIEKEGYERIDDNILLARRLLDFLGLSEESIKKLAVKEQEMQENG